MLRLLPRPVRVALVAFAAALFAMLFPVAAGAEGPVAIGPGATPVDPESDAFLAEFDAVGRRGFLYEVGGRDGKRLFLYGTIHLGRVGSEPFNGPVLAALRASTRVALEADPTDAARTEALTLALGRYDTGDGLERHVPPELLARLTAFGASRRMPVERLVRLKPWLLASVIALSDFAEHGLDASMGSEMYLAGFARGMGMPVVEIEGIEPQLRLMSGLPEPMQVAQLDEALADAASGDARSQGEELFELWQRGRRADGDALLATMRRDASDKPFERYFLGAVIDARNDAMLERAIRLLDEPGDTFFAVGCLHLFGPTGLLDAFARRGFRVVDLQPQRAEDPP